jgi:glycerol uptake facilitator protein
MKPPSLPAQLAAEFIGTMIIILFGAGVCSMTVLFGTGVPGEVVKGGYTNITLGWGLGVTFGVWASARISGAHLNPAVTLAVAVFRDFRWSHVLPFIAAQTAGAFAGAALVFMNYRAAFQQFDPLLEKSAGIFTTFPAFPAQPAAGFIDQVIGTAILLFLVLAVTDDRNEPAPAWFSPLAIGLIVVGIGMSFGALHGYAINPARDFGPRMFIILAGFRNNGLTDASGVWWVPVVAPMLGGLIGAGVYDLGIRRFLPRA